MFVRNGYSYVFLPKHHRAEKSSGMVAYHVVVMEEHLGRELLKDEVVHHKDFNRSNNDVSNLEVMTAAEHNRLHGLLRGAVKELKICICGKEHYNSRYCSNACCNIGRRKVVRPSKEELVLLLKELSFAKVAKLFGVSHTAVEYWGKCYNISKKEL